MTPPPDPDLPPPGQRPMRGDEAELFVRLNQRLEREVARNVNTSRANVEDACTFAWEQLHRYQPDRGTVWGYLKVTALREAVRLDRIDRAHLSLDKLSPDGATRVETLPAQFVDHERVELLDLAAEAVKSLPQREGLVLFARAVGYSVEETAAMIGSGPKTVQRLHRRARQRLDEREAAEHAEELGRLPEAPLVSHAKQLQSRPPRYLRDALGRVPQNKDSPHRRLTWLRGAIAIERYRLTENVDDERSALGRRPPPEDPRRERWDAANRVVEGVCEQLGHDLGPER